MAQLFQKFLAEQAFAAQIGDVLLVEMQIPDIAHDLLQSRGYGKAAPVGHRAEEYVEIADAVFQARLEIAVAHGGLVKVEEHRVVVVVLHVS